MAPRLTGLPVSSNTVVKKSCLQGAAIKGVCGRHHIFNYGITCFIRHTSFSSLSKKYSGGKTEIKSVKLLRLNRFAFTWIPAFILPCLAAGGPKKFKVLIGLPSPGPSAFLSSSAFTRIRPAQILYRETLRWQQYDVGSVHLLYNYRW